MPKLDPKLELSKVPAPGSNLQYIIPKLKAAVDENMLIKMILSLHERFGMLPVHV